jgi:RNA polymerase sigma-70 factor (ECF subfamily)
LTQQFFVQLIAKQHLRRADRNKGRFRSFLLSTLHYFLAREWCRAHRQRRGGHCQFISLDQQHSEERYRFEPVDRDTPEKSFQRQWALAVLKQAMTALANECAEMGKANLFSEVKQLLAGDRESATYADMGGRLSMTEGAVRVAVCRLRQRYGELLRAEIAQTVASEGEVEEEVRHLMRALSE